MDVLTHLTLPLLVVYVLSRERFSSPAVLAIGVFGLLSDGDKFIGTPGMLHSLITLVPLCLTLVGIEYAYRGELYWSPLVVGLIGSHLVLDLVDGGPVPLLFPLVKTGIGLQYPAQTVFGQGPLGLVIEGPLLALRTTAPRPGFNTYGFIQGSGVASTLALLIVYWRLRSPTDRGPVKNREQTSSQ